MTEQKKPRVYLVMPRGGPMAVYGAVIGLAHCSRGEVEVMLAESQGASHERNSNGAWFDALNRRDLGEVDLFAFQHADVCPEPGWVDIHWKVMQEQNVAMVSSVIPFRDFSGLTSTGIDNMENKFAPRRLTMKEILRLPKSFQYKDVLAAKMAPDPNSRLILNTGLILIDLRRERWGNWQDGVRFLFEHRQQTTKEPIQAPDGSVVPVGHRWFEMASEDWELSRQLSDRKIPYCASREAKLRHVGNWHWSNQEDFLEPIRPGGQETDELYAKKMEQDRLEKLLKEAHERGRQAGLAEAGTPHRTTWNEFLYASLQDANRPGEL